MRMFLLLLILNSLFATNTLANSDSYFYRIRPGDQLGTILFSLGFKNLWGKSGSVSGFASKQKDPVKGQGARILQNGDLVQPGTWIEFALDIPLKCNISIFAKEITQIKKILKTQKSRLAFRCSDDTRNNLRDIASVEVQAFEKHGRIIIKPRLSYFKSSLVDSSNAVASKVSSEASIGVNARWEQVWSEKHSFYLQADAQKVKIRAPSTRTIQGESGATLAKFGFGYLRNFGSHFSIEADLNYGNDFFITAPSSSTLELQTGNLISANMMAKYTFADFSPFSFGAHLGTHFLGSADLKESKSKAGMGISAGLFTRQIFSNNKFLIGDILLRKQSKDTNMFEQDDVEIRYNFGVSWELK